MARSCGHGLLLAPSNPSVLFAQARRRCAKWSSLGILFFCPTGIPATMSFDDRCRICNEQAKTNQEVAFVGFQQECLRCGRFGLTERASDLLSNASLRNRADISGWVYEQNLAGATPKISDHVFGQIVDRTPPSVAERADRLLLAALRGQSKLGEAFFFHTPHFLAATYSQDDEELRYLFRMLTKGGLIGDHPEETGVGAYGILPEGYRLAHRLSHGPGHSDNGFIAMWFDDKMDSAYEHGLRAGVANAGYVPRAIQKSS